MGSDTAKEILFLKPVFKQTIWGGSRLGREFGYEEAGDGVGECWAISAHANGDCEIQNGTYAGMTLSSLWKEHHALFGAAEGEQFPLLIKIIDAKDDLSIQVHPDDTYAKEHENGSLGKTECWYILDCAEDATIVIGHHAKTREEMAQMIADKRWTEFIREIPVKKGDFFQINPGCIHAIKGGTLILETQQSSDITYRVYDYDRLTNGKPRELHIAKSLDVVTVPFVEEKTKPVAQTLEGSTVTKLVECSYYTVEKLDITSSYTLPEKDRFVNVSIVSGTGTIDGIPVGKGTHCILPAEYGNAVFAGQMSAIISYVS